MQSKISFCNRAVVKKDITRFWPLWAIELFLLQYGNFYSCFSIQSIMNSKNLLMHDKVTEAKLCLAGVVTSNTNVFLAAIFAVAAAILVFGYLSHKASCYAIHSMPLNRKTLFCSHFVAGLIMLIMPCALSYLVTEIINLSFGLGFGANIFGMFLEIILIIIFFYSMACMVVMLSGNGIISALIYGVLNVLAFGISFMFAGFFNYSVYGGVGFSVQDVLKWVIHLTPVYYFSVASGNNAFRVVSGFLLGEPYYGRDVPDDSVVAQMAKFPWEGVGKCALYLLPAAVLCVAAWFLYKKRPLERTGDMMLFSWAKTVFRIVFSISGGIFLVLLYDMGMENFSFGKITYQTVFWLQLILLFACCIVCYLVGEMILLKSFRIWKRLSFVQMGVTCAIMAVLVIFSKQVLQKSGMIDVENAKRVEISLGGISYYYKGGEIPEELERLQRKVLDAGKKEIFHSDMDSSSVEITFGYKAKDDSGAMNWYMLSEDKNKELISEIEDFFRKQEKKEEKMFPEPCGEENILSFGTSGIIDEGEDEITNADILTVLDGVIEDIKEGNIEVEDWKKYRKYMDDMDHGKVLYLSFDHGEEGTVNQEICLDEKCVHTLKALETVKSH